MSLHKYFKRALPTSEETGLGEATTRTVNQSMQRVLDGCEKSAKKPRKERTVYSDTDRAAIGKYAAENGNTSAQKNFKEKVPELYWYIIFTFLSSKRKTKIEKHFYKLKNHKIALLY